MKRFALVAAAALFLTGCAQTPPPVSAKVQSAYEKGSQLVTPSAPAKLPMVAFIGDSYSAGAGASGYATRWTTRLALQEGWIERNFALGGTGYLITAGQAGCGKDVCPNYSGVIKTAAASKPDMVLVAGGRNDSGLPKEDRDVAIAAFFKNLRAALPKTRIAVVSPLWDASRPSPAMAEIADAVKAAAAENDVSYLDVGQPLAGHDEWIDTDGVHPLDAGHAAIATAVRAKVQKLPALTAAK